MTMDVVEQQQKVMEHQKTVQQQFATAVTEAMRQPGKEAVGYSPTDRRVLAEESTRLRARADRLDALSGPEGASNE